jgi:hypothetical protein
MIRLHDVVGSATAKGAGSTRPHQRPSGRASLLPRPDTPPAPRRHDAAPPTEDHAKPDPGPSTARTISVGFAPTGTQTAILCESNANQRQIKPESSQQQLNTFCLIVALVSNSSFSDASNLIAKKKSTPQDQP